MALCSVHPLIFTALAILASAASLGAYNVNQESVSISGFSSGGFMSAQLGVAYSSIFKIGFGVFAGGPYDCARNQPNASCMWNNTPSIATPMENIISWSGSEIDNVANLRHRRIYIQTGESDSTIGMNVVSQLRAQLSGFITALYTSYIVTPGAEHNFPTDFDGLGNSPCDVSMSPHISNCGYDGAGAVLEWMYGALNPRRTAKLTGEVVPFDQRGPYGAPGMDKTGYLYVPSSCGGRSTGCALHVVLHGCRQNYGLIGNKFVYTTGYNQWADTNDIIVLYPQTTVDNSLHMIWDGVKHANLNACWDWIGLYGDDTDQKGGVQMVAIVNQVKQIIGGYSRHDTVHEL